MSYNRCSLCRKNINEVDYRDVNFLKNFTAFFAKIKPVSESKTCSKHQRIIKTAIKRSRYMALMPFTTR